MTPEKAETLKKLRASVGQLSTTTLRQLEKSLPWYSRLNSDERSALGMVAQNGIAAFVTWYERPSSPSWILSDVFGTAPTELTRSISLQKALQLIRIVVEVVEDQVPVIAPEADQSALREAVLRYSREVAFAAADVYARAAESRGSWDTRLEALIVDAILRGENTDALRSRIAALGWKAQERFTVMVGEFSLRAKRQLRQRTAPHRGAFRRGRPRGDPGRPPHPHPRRGPRPGDRVPETQRTLCPRPGGLRPRGRFPPRSQRLRPVGLRRPHRGPRVARRAAPGGGRRPAARARDLRRRRRPPLPGQEHLPARCWPPPTGSSRPWARTSNWVIRSRRRPANSSSTPIRCATGSSASVTSRAGIRSCRGRRSCSRPPSWWAGFRPRPKAPAERQPARNGS